MVSKEPTKSNKGPIRPHQADEVFLDLDGRVTTFDAWGQIGRRTSNVSTLEACTPP